MSFTCKHCGADFRLLVSLNKHRAAKHKDIGADVDAEPEFACPFCRVKVKKKYSLQRHIRNRHPGCQNIPSSSVILCEVCDFGCGNYVQLASHYRQIHNQPVEIKNTKFATLDEFDKWKANVEAETRSQFIVKTVFKKKNGTVRKNMRCNRSGNFQSVGKGKRQPKKGVSNKIGVTCPAFMNVDLRPDGEVQVAFSLFHYKHDNCLTAQRLPKMVKDQVAQLIVAGVGEEEILRKFANPTDKTLKRQHLLAKYDIKNIKRQRGLTCSYKKDPNDSISVAKWIEEMKMEEWNPILLFKQPDQVDDRYLIGIQFKEQASWLKLYGNDETICVDTIHSKSGEGFYLVTLLVVDDKGRGLPVAWLISNQETEANLTRFFDDLKTRVVDVVHPRVFVSDDNSPQYSNAWARTFGANQWRSWLQVVNNVDFLEEYRRGMKDKYLAATGRRERRTFRVDRLISVLKKIYSENVEKEKAKSNSSQANTEEDICGASTISNDNVTIIGSGEVSFIVRCVNDECPKMENCSSKCPRCTVCPHMFTCTCPFAAETSQLTSVCKHRHKISSMRNTSKRADVSGRNVVESMEEDLFATDFLMSEEDHREDAALLKQEIKFAVECFFETCDDKDILKSMLSQIREFRSKAMKGNKKKKPIGIKRSTEKS